MTATKRTGRPKDPAKRQAILAAAKGLFFQNGFDATTIEEIAAAAGVSKVTVYGHFGDKESILEGVVTGEADRMTGAIDMPEGGSTEQLLCRFAMVIGGFLLSDEIVRGDRMLSGETARNPALAKRFYESGPARMHGLLQQIIVRGQERGEIDPADPKEAAHDFFGLVMGFRARERRFGVRKQPTASEIEQLARRSAARFMKAYSS